jgi:hypothetical protein
MARWIALPGASLRAFHLLGKRLVAYNVTCTRNVLSYEGILPNEPGSALAALCLAGMVRISVAISEKFPLQITDLGSRGAGAPPLENQLGSETHGFAVG